MVTGSPGPRIDLSKVGYLGPAGSFTEEATIAFNPRTQRVPFPSIPAVAQAVEAGEVDGGVVPIENSLEGAVTYTLDLLIHGSHLFIHDELVLPIHHNLLTSPGTSVEEIRVIYSHPQALAQCRRYLEERLPGAEPIAALSTSSAVAHLSQEPGSGAVGTLRAAQIYGAEILDRAIEDSPNNATRFVLLAHGDHAPMGRDKTSVCFTFDQDAPGLLHSVLECVLAEGINMAKIESRPNKLQLGRYFFLLDLDGHRLDANVARALECISARVTSLKVLGSYPRHRP